MATRVPGSRRAAKVINRRSGCTSLIDSNLLLHDPVPLGESQRIVY